MTATAALVSFWFGDLPIIPGHLRIIFYSWLFLFYAFRSHGPLYDQHRSVSSALNGVDCTPWGAHELERSAGRRMPSHTSFMSWVYPVGRHTLVARLHRCVLLCWGLSCAGLGGRWPRLLFALGSFILWGGYSHWRFNHRWHLPMYTIIVLALGPCDDAWSVDAFIKRTMGGYLDWFPTGQLSKESLLWAAGVRKLALVIVAIDLFNPFICKMLYSGLRWMDGATLEWYLRHPRTHRNSRFPQATRFIGSSSFLCAVLASMTVLFEAGSIFLIFSPRIRFAYFLVAFSFHFGIWLVMGPNFLPQLACYIAVAGVGETAMADQETLIMLPWVTMTAVAFTMASLALLAVAVFGVEAWPLSGLDMYAHYCARDDYPKHLHSFAHLQKMLTQSFKPYHSFPESWFQVRLYRHDDDADQSQELALSKLMRKQSNCKGPDGSFVHTLQIPVTRALINDLRALSPKIQPDPVHGLLAFDFPCCSALLLELIPKLRKLEWARGELPAWAHATVNQDERSGSNCCLLQIICSTGGVWYPLVQVPWALQ